MKRDHLSPAVQVANMSRSLDSFLDDSVDVILQERENRELHAGMFMIKNSDFGRRFILVCCGFAPPFAVCGCCMHQKQLSYCRIG